MCISAPLVGRGRYSPTAREQSPGQQHGGSLSLSFLVRLSRQCLVRESDCDLTSDKRFISTSFPRSSQYHPEWVLASVSGGANSLWLTEWLTSALDFGPGMRVLDLGCGRAASSIFLRREFGVQVWATDLWFSVSEN